MACKKLTNISLAELYKRVPTNQKQMFLKFRDLQKEYEKRVNKHPEHLPKIDWDYYRKNVRRDYVAMVDMFEKKYKELNKIFDGRMTVRTEKYYEELEKMKCEVQADVEQYIDESNKRIKVYEAEIERIRSMIPFEQMTCEDFVELCPDRASLIGCGKEPGFWPHTPEEQTPGPALQPAVGTPEGDTGQGAGAGKAKEKGSEKPKPQ